MAFIQIYEASDGVVHSELLEKAYIMLIYQNLSQIKCLHHALPLHNYQTAYCEISFQFPQSQIHICPFLKIEYQTLLLLK